MAKFDTYGQAGIAEDVQDVIYNVSPVDNPVAAMSRTIRASGNNAHEWQEDRLKAAESNKKVEGADAGADQSQSTDRLSNFNQIMDKVAEISGSLEEADKYGRRSEMAYQLELRYGELANDEELAIIGAPGDTRQTGNAGNTSTAREMKCFQVQILDTTGARPDANNVVSSTASGAGGIAALENEMLDAWQVSYNRGGNPRYIIIPDAIARYIAAFALAGSNKRRDFGTGRELVNVIDEYASPFGTVDVVLDRHAESNGGVGNNESIIAGIDFAYSQTPVFRATRDYPLARNGDHDRRQIIRESTYALTNRDSGFMVQAISTGLQ